MPQASKYTESAEKQKTEMDAVGIKTSDEVKPRNPSVSEFSFPCFQRIP
jgi:hypothetical protein